MGCIKEENGTVRAVLSFKREELLYDISNCAYIEGHVLESANEEQRHMVQDVAQEGNVDRVTRVLDLAVAQCRELLYPYIRHDIHRAELNDELKETAVYGMVLNVPEGFSQTTLNLLERLIHEYLVSKSVADWMSITNPGKAGIWAQKADEAETEIRRNLNTRMGRVRLRMHPF